MPSSAADVACDRFVEEDADALARAANDAEGAFVDGGRIVIDGIVEAFAAQPIDSPKSVERDVRMAP